MQKYSIVQISDIHLTSATTNDIRVRFERAAQALKTVLLGGVKDVLLILAGDLAYSGSTEQFDALVSILEEFSSALAADGYKAHFVFVPGNHDCDFTESPVTSMRHTLVDGISAKLSREPSNPEILKTFLQVQTNFRAFTQKFGVSVSENSLVTVVEFPDLKAKVNLVNTAWASTRKESKDLPFVLAELEKLESENGWLNITTFHHPKPWIDRTISGDFMTRIGADSDFVFTGHEHTNSHYEQKYIGCGSQTYFEGAAFFEPGTPNGFRALLVDLDGGTYTVNDLKWNSEDSVFEREEYRGIDIPRNPRQNALGVSFSNSFRGFLVDPGMNISHPAKKNLQLKDFFVFPRLVEDYASLSAATSTHVITTVSECRSYLDKQRVNLIVGDDKSGKTALLKVLIEEIFAEGKLPIYIEGTEINSKSDVVITNLLERKIKEQYGEKKGLRLIQDPKFKLVVVIDGFDAISLKSGDICEVLNQIRSVSETVILSADSSIETQALNDPRFNLATEDMGRIQVAPMSVGQRNQLISNWYELYPDGREESVRIYQIQNAILRQINEFGIPNYPIFVLTHLQFADPESALGLRISSNSKLVETLIDQGLNNLVDPVIDNKTKYAYLREFAFNLFTSGKTSFSSEEVERFHAEFTARKDLAISQQKIWEELVRAKVLIVDENKGSGFRYNYFRTYFVANYIGYNFTQPSMKELVRDIAKNAHHNENANILAGLTVNTSDTFIHDLLVEKLRECLHSIPERTHVELADAVSKIADLSSMVLIPGSTVGEEAVGPSPSEEVRKRVEESADLNESAVAVTQAVRLIRVLGQLLRNTTTTLDGNDKKKIVEVIYSASARILGLYTLAIDGGSEELLMYLAAKIKEDNPELATTEIADTAKKRLLQVLFASAVSLVDVVSRAIGDELLQKTYGRVLATPGLEGFWLYDLGIRLDWFKHFPKPLLLDAYSAHRHNHFLGTILKYLGFRALIVRSDLRVSDQQEVTAKLELSLKGVLQKGLLGMRRSRT